LKRALIYTVVAAALAGCVAVKPAPAPKVDLPPKWDHESAQQGDPVTTNWFRGFGSQELDGLIDTGNQVNYDLKAADARLRQADARARAAHAALLPDVGVGGSGNYYDGHTGHGTYHETDWSVLLSASYEIDFWGKNRAAFMSAAALHEASQADRAVVGLTTQTSIARTYFQVVASREKVALAKATLDTAKQVLDVVERRRETHLSNPVELAQQRALVAAAEVHVKDMEQQESEQEAALAILVGKMPGALTVDAQHLSDFTVPRVAAGLPAALLSRRPDVFSAEATLRSANADVIQARAAFFPSVTLTGALGLANPAVNAAVNSLAGTGPSLNLGAAVMQSIFNGGRLRAARDEAQGKEEEMLAQYQGALLSALWDVEVALSAIERLDQQESAQMQSVAESERALAGAEDRHRAGSGDFMAVLDTQRTLVTAREQWSQYQLDRLQAAVGLCKALGGGWERK
jgi:outer membrane protein, multidrug efflux system